MLLSSFWASFQLSLISQHTNDHLVTGHMSGLYKVNKGRNFDPDHLAADNFLSLGNLKGFYNFNYLVCYGNKFSQTAPAAADRLTINNFRRKRAQSCAVDGD